MNLLSKKDVKEHQFRPAFGRDRNLKQVQKGIRFRARRQVQEKPSTAKDETLWLGLPCPFFESSLNLHERLETGLSRESLVSLRRTACLHWQPLPVEGENSNFLNIFQCSAREAWERFVGFMDRVQEGWPIPLSLGSGDSYKSVSQVVARRQVLLQRVFLSAPPAVQIDLAVGKFTAWSSIGPRSSLCWEQGVILSVAAGIHLQLLVDALAHLGDEPSDSLT